MALAAVAAIPALPAFAAEASRTEYKAAAEPICKADTQANERILAGVRKEVQQGKLKPAASRFTEASLALKKALHELEQVPRPDADEARLAGWFSYVKIEAELFATAGHNLRSGDKPGGEHIVTKLSQNANKANLQVLPFGLPLLPPGTGPLHPSRWRGIGNREPGEVRPSASERGGGRGARGDWRGPR